MLENNQSFILLANSLFTADVLAPLKSKHMRVRWLEPAHYTDGPVALWLGSMHKYSFSMLL